MPDDLLQLVLELCTRAEETGLWPRQAVLGVVAALEKRLNAEGVNDYRPITVLSVVYRTWSSIRARQALQYVASFAPPGMYGNIAGRTAGQLWYSVQLAVESANYRRTPMLGFIADLEKAFNLLPRTPVFALARAVGIAEPIVRGWCGAMVALERRFRIRQSIGPAIRSSTGFPEGCGLSCLAMALVDLALHAHVSDSVPGATLATYVDNWEGHAPDATTLLSAHRAVEDFTSAWDLKLDVSKTVCWGTTASARRQLRAAGMKVCLDCRDLGGHLQFSQRKPNYTLTSRLEALGPLWTRLRASYAPAAQKVRALSVSAWPRGLHGVSGISLGSQHFCKLRSGAMHGLAWDRPGASPLLHLSLISYPTSDPEFYAIRQTVLDLRQNTVRHEVAPLISEVVACPGRRSPGPIGVLLDRVATLMWTWDASAETFSDMLSPFCLWEVSVQELELRVVLGWQQHVTCLVKERPGFGGIVDVDPLLTRQLCKERPGPEQALLQVALGGSFFTEDKLCHIEEGGVPFCRFCGAVDGIRHRVWECPGLATAREQAVTPGTPDLAFLPECQLLHAWAMRPGKQFELWRVLCLLPSSIRPFELHAPRRAYDLFTDGTCLLPSQPQVRLAAWAVTLAREDSMPPFVLNSGLLPGLIQTSFRAEIFAVLAAVRFCRLVGAPVRIWCDCLGVVRRVRKLLRGSNSFAANIKNGDLWSCLREETSGLENLLDIQKVPAHEELQDDDDAVTEWLLTNNADVDAAARAANLARGEAFWELWEEVRKDLAYQTFVGRAVLKMHGAIGVVASRRDESRFQAVERDFQPRPEQAMTLGSQDVSGDGAFARRYGARYQRELSDWLPHFVYHPICQQAPLRWISILQLLCSFVLETGRRPPFFDSASRTWYEPDDRVRGHLITVEARKLATWFGRSLRAFVIATGGNYHSEDIRPDSAALQIKLRSIPCQLETCACQRVEELLARRLPGGVCSGRSTTWASIRF